MALIGPALQSGKQCVCNGNSTCQCQQQMWLMALTSPSHQSGSQHVCSTDGICQCRQRDSCLQEPEGCMCFIEAALQLMSSMPALGMGHASATSKRPSAGAGVR